MALVTENALTIEHDAKQLYDAKSNSYDILMSVAREEAAKALILFDAVRCPRQSEEFGRQLRRFNEHLAKGIYAEVCELEVCSKNELCKYLSSAREQFYLDGPNDVDWIFPNQILSRREGHMYVDYVESDGDYYWSNPFKLEKMFGHYRPRVLSIATALQSTGCMEPSALHATRRIWQQSSIDASSSYKELRAVNYKSLEELEKLDLLDDSDDASIGMIVNNLPFPLYDVDLSLVKVDQKSLESIQETRTGA